MALFSEKLRPAEFQHINQIELNKLSKLMSNKPAFSHSWKTVILIESTDEKTQKITQSSSKNLLFFFFIPQALYD